jgi:hypothetical protein
MNRLLKTINPAYPSPVWFLANRPTPNAKSATITAPNQTPVHGKL